MIVMAMKMIMIPMAMAGAAAGKMIRLTRASSRLLRHKCFYLPFTEVWLWQPKCPMFSQKRCSTVPPTSYRPLISIYLRYSDIPPF